MALGERASTELVEGANSRASTGSARIRRGVRSLQLGRLVRLQRPGTAVSGRLPFALRRSPSGCYESTERKRRPAPRYRPPARGICSTSRSKRHGSGYRPAQAVEKASGPRCQYQTCIRFYAPGLWLSNPCRSQISDRYGIPGTPSCRTCREADRSENLIST